MSTARQIDLTGGESVYCINTLQMEKAIELYDGESDSGNQLRAAVEQIEDDLSRNEQAALAMVLLQRLRVGPAK